MTFFTLTDENADTVNNTDKVLFRTANEFSQYITKLARDNDDSLTTTILQYCEDRDLDPEDIAKLISKPLKESLAEEMKEAGLLPKDKSVVFE